MNILEYFVFVSESLCNEEWQEIEMSSIFVTFILISGLKSHCLIFFDIFGSVPANNIDC